MSARNNFSPSKERDEFKCPICWDFAFEPQCLKPCAHFICKKCLQSMKTSESSSNCPVCRGNIANSFPFKEMELEMAQLKEKCPGCEEMIALPTMKEHVQKCTTLSQFEGYSNQMNTRQVHPRRSPFQKCSRRNMPRGQGLRITKEWQESHNERENHDELFTRRQRKSDDENHCNDQEESDEFSCQDYQQRRHCNSQRQHFRPETHNDVQRFQFRERGRRRGQRNRNGRCGRGFFGRSHWNSRGREDRHEWNPKPSKDRDSDDETESASGASQMLALGYFDPSQGARPKYLPNFKRSTLEVDLPRHSSMAAMGCASLVSENASAASSIPSSSLKYTCPYCGEPGLCQSDLVNHCLEQHSSEKRQVVCPVCASMPWGNPNQRSANFIDHLRIRHSYDYKDYVLNDDDEEDAMLSMALNESLRYF